MKKTNVYLICVLLPLLLSFCEEKENFEYRAAKQQTIIKNPGTYQQAMEDRYQISGETFTIEEVARENNQLKIIVRGGCSDASFSIYWDGSVLESYPMQVHLVLTHTPTEQCQDAEVFTLTYNLQDILGAEADFSDYVFHIANGSSQQDRVLNPEEVVSN